MNQSMFPQEKKKNKQKHRFYCLETFQKMAPSDRHLIPKAAMSGGLILMVESNAPKETGYL